MPQPLSNLIKGKASVSLITSPDALSTYPKLAEKVMKVIGIWSMIDTALVNIASLTLKADFVIVAEMLNKLIGSEAKRDVIFKAVEAAHPKDWPLLQVIWKISKSSKDRRNEYAHHIWATSPEVTDALCLVDPKDAVLDYAHSQNLQAYFQQITNTDGSVDIYARKTKIPPEYRKWDPSKVMVFRETDVNNDVRDALKALDLIGGFSVAISSHPKADDKRNELLSLPEVQLYLQKLPP